MKSIKKHGDLLRKEKKLNKKSEKEKTRKEFTTDSLKFAKVIFIESKRETLNCTKEELENHQKHAVTQKEPYLKKSGIPFDMLVLKTR